MSAFDDGRLVRAGASRGKSNARRPSSRMPLMLMVAAGLLLTVSRIEPGAFDAVRAPLIAAVAPVLEVCGRALQPITGLATRLRDYVVAANETERAQADAARLAAAGIRIEDLERENRDLKRLTHYAGSGVQTAAARVVARSPGPLSQTLLIDAGRTAGIKIGLPVTAGTSVLGRVTLVHARFATVLLLADPQSRTPVEIGNNRTRAVLTGTGGPSPKLEFLAGGAAISAGDLVATSGIGGVFPRGMPVGTVVADGPDWTVSLSASAQETAAVGVLMLEAGTFDAARLQQAAAPAASQAPK